MLIIESDKIGVEKVLLTIRKHNIPSINVALANGGQVEKTTDERCYIGIDVN